MGLKKQQRIKKGIILAGGSGTRLYPITKVVSKQLLPVYDKPMIYYPLSVLMLSDIRDILIISTPMDLPFFEMLFGDGSNLGLNISYMEQPKPEGLAQAFILGSSFIGNDGVCLILGDNIFYGHDLSNILQTAVQLEAGGLIFGYAVRDPERYGVVEFDKWMNATDIIEKPKNPKSMYAVPGLYFYDSSVVELAKSLKPSARGELEITDINRIYLIENRLKVQILGRGFAWLDTGTPEALQQAASYVQAIQERQGFRIACIEEIAYRKNFVDGETILKRSSDMFHNEYGQYIKKVITEIPE